VNESHIEDFLAAMLRLEEAPEIHEAASTISDVEFFSITKAGNGGEVIENRTQWPARVAIHLSA
jgi:hypothetical protein